MKEQEKAGVAVLEVDSVTESIVVAAMMSDPAVRRNLAARVTQDAFAEPKHQAAVAAMRELDRRGLEFDLAVLPELAEGVDTGYLARLAEVRPDAPPNLEHHVQTILWDRARITAWQGPIAGLVSAVKDPRSDRERVRALARQVSGSFDGFGDRGHLLDPARTVRDQVAEIRQRRAGYAVYPYGVDAVDLAVPAAGTQEASSGTPLLIPGSAPGLVTVVTGISGSGKSTVTANMILGLARKRRKVLVGAWEMTGGMTLELLACLSLGYSRTSVTLGKLTDEQIGELEKRMTGMSRYVRFMSNPFRKQVRERASNERNLDTVHGYIADTGADVFVADLWERCLEDDEPSSEKRALFRQQAMAEETRCHVILLAQQRLKDIESRPDKRPTREGIKGSSAYVDIADTILGTHRPALFKAVPDDKIEVCVLKQRYGRWPVCIECDWSPDRGTITNGREVTYESTGEQGGAMAEFLATPSAKKGSRR